MLSGSTNPYSEGASNAKAVCTGLRSESALNIFCDREDTTSSSSTFLPVFLLLTFLLKTIVRYAVKVLLLFSLRQFQCQALPLALLTTSLLHGHVLRICLLSLAKSPNAIGRLQFPAPQKM